MKGTKAISMTLVPLTTSDAVSGAVGKPNAAIAARSWRPFASVGRTGMSRSPVNRGAP
jgi:hypothetical protein